MNKSQEILFRELGALAESYSREELNLELGILDMLRAAVFGDRVAQLWDCCVDYAEERLAQLDAIQPQNFVN